MDAIDKYIDIVYNDKHITENELWDMTSDNANNIILGLIKQNKYAQAEEIISLKSPNIIYPIKMRKLRWENPNNINNNNLYINEKNITKNCRELYNHIFIYKQYVSSLTSLLCGNMIHSKFLIKDKRILKILCKYYLSHKEIFCEHSLNLHAIEELTPYLYSKFYKHKINKFYYAEQIYELRILQKFHMLEMPLIKPKSNLIAYIIMNYEKNIDTHYLSRTFKFIFE